MICLNPAALIPRNECAQKRVNQRGTALLSLSIIIIILGLITGSGLQLYKIYQWHKAEETTRKHLDVIETALMDFFHREGRFPCAASINAPPDTQNGNTRFGEEINGNCKTSSRDGTWLQAGRFYTSEIVRIGGVPTRTLGIHDKYMLDGWGHRIVYALDADAVETGYWQTSGDEPGSIYLIDDFDLRKPESWQTGFIGWDSLRLYGSDLEDLVEDESLISPEGGAIYVLVAPGQDSRGAYNRQGQEIKPCVLYTLAWENCDYTQTSIFLGGNGDNIFIAAPQKQYNGNVNDFTATLRYKGKFQKGGNE